MNDTKPTAASKFRQLIMLKTQEERLLMGFSMFEAARQIVKTAIINQNPGISSEARKREIFLRFYGGDFSEIEKDKILSVLMKGSK